MIDLKRLVKLTSVNSRKIIEKWRQNSRLWKKISRLFSKLSLLSSLSDIWWGTQVSISRGSKSIFILSLFTSEMFLLLSKFTKEWRRGCKLQNFFLRSNKLFFDFRFSIGVPQSHVHKNQFLPFQDELLMPLVDFRLLRHFLMKFFCWKRSRKSLECQRGRKSGPQLMLLKAQQMGMDPPSNPRNPL